MQPENRARTHMLKRIKRSVLAASKASGVSSIVRRSRWRRQRLTILCYHGVALDAEHHWNPSLYMSVDMFEERLHILTREGYPVLPLGEALQQLREGSLPRGAVTLTFDDGMYDFYSRVAPLLARYRVPATVYLTTFYSGFGGPVFGIFCAFMLFKAGRAVLDLGTLIPGERSYDLAHRGEREAALAAIHRYARDYNLGATGRDRFVDLLGEALHVDVADLRARRILHVMNDEEVREVASAGVDFQLHTHRHRVPVDRTLFLREIHDNREKLRELVGKETTHFCYPSGVYRREFLPWLTEAGVESATTCDPGIAAPTTPALLLPRVVDGGQLSPVEFEAWLSGVASFLPQRASSFYRYAP